MSSPRGGFGDEGEKTTRRDSVAKRLSEAAQTVKNTAVVFRDAGNVMVQKMSEFAEMVSKNLKALHTQFQGYLKRDAELAKQQAAAAAAGNQPLEAKIGAERMQNFVQAADAAATVIIETATQEAKQRGETFTENDAASVRESIRGSVRMPKFTLEALEQVVDETLRTSIAVKADKVKPVQSKTRTAPPPIPQRPDLSKSSSGMKTEPPPVPASARRSVRLPMPPIVEATDKTRFAALKAEMGNTTLKKTGVPPKPAEVKHTQGVVSLQDLLIRRIDEKFKNVKERDSNSGGGRPPSGSW